MDHLASRRLGDSFERVFWVNGADEALYAHCQSLYRAGRLPTHPTFGEYVAQIRNRDAEPLAQAPPEAADAPGLGLDPRPAWIEAAVSVIVQLCHERKMFSSANVWPHCRYPQGFGGAALMRKAFRQAEERGLIALARLSDGTVRALVGDELPAVVSLDGTRVRLGDIIALYRPLGTHRNAGESVVSQPSAEAR